MKEKIMVFFQNEKVKRLNKKVFNKKTLIAAIVILGIASALRISFSLMFEINGIVKNIDGKNITVANFLTTRTVDVGDYPITSNEIQIGDRIEITKNLSGEVLYVRDESKKHINGNRKIDGNSKQNFKGDRKNNSKERD
jgi:LPS O-antigen subunit length determinant protein (WzzB/FepE family)